MMSAAVTSVTRIRQDCFYMIYLISQKLEISGLKKRYIEVLCLILPNRTVTGNPLNYPTVSQKKNCDSLEFTLIEK